MITKLTECLFLGDGSDAEKASKTGEFDSIITVADQCQYYGDIHIKLIDDARTENRLMFKSAITVVNTYLRVGHRILVSCSAGMSRSPAVCVGHLITSTNMKLSEAIDYVKSKRPSVSIHPYFKHQLNDIKEDIDFIDEHLRRQHINKK